MYISVLGSSLTAFIIGGSEITVSVGTTVILDGITASTDPDIIGTGTDTDLQFSWSCMSGQVDMNTNISNGNHFEYYSCPRKVASVYNHTSGILEIDTSILGTGSITFRMVIEKDIRSAYYDQLLHVTSGYVPGGLQVR